MLRSNRIPSHREQRVAFAVLIALAAIAGWMLLTQARFSPAVTATLEMPVAGTAQPASAVRAALLPTWPDTVRPMSPLESFSPATLSDKIDGKAELYLAAGFVAMRCQRLALKTAADSWLEMFVYEMSGPEQAFAVYSSQKRNVVTDLALGDHGYAAGNQVCFVHGKFYGEVIGADEMSATHAAALALARSFVAAHAVAPHREAGADGDLFPRGDQIAGSTMLLSTDVFGFDQLKNVFVSRYQTAAGGLTLYLARRAGEAEAVQLTQAVHRFFVDDCGGKPAGSLVDVPGASIIEIAGSFEVVFATGSFVAGVHEAPTREAAESAAVRLKAALAGKR